MSRLSASLRYCWYAFRTTVIPLVMLHWPDPHPKKVMPNLSPNRSSKGSKALAVVANRALQSNVPIIVWLLLHLLSSCSIWIPTLLLCPNNFVVERGIDPPRGLCCLSLFIPSDKIPLFSWWFNNIFLVAYWIAYSAHFSILTDFPWTVTILRCAARLADNDFSTRRKSVLVHHARGPTLAPVTV